MLHPDAERERVAHRDHAQRCGARLIERIVAESVRVDLDAVAPVLARPLLDHAWSQAIAEQRMFDHQRVFGRVQRIQP